MAQIPGPLKWFPLDRRHAPAVRLFCLPHAGGGPWAFRDWTSLLPPAVETLSIHLPGRGPRLREEPFTRMDPLVRELERSIRPLLDMPFALFGHSVGALVGFELARALTQRGSPPFHLFVAGKIPPDLPDPNPRLHELADQAFLEELRALNGIPQQLLEYPEMIEAVLPAARADFAVLETYECSPSPPLGCPISVFAGRDDPRTRGLDMDGWGRQTSSDFTVEILPGDHFFVQASQSELLGSISSSLQKRLPGGSENPRHG